MTGRLMIDDVAPNSDPALVQAYFDRMMASLDGEVNSYTIIRVDKPIAFTAGDRKER